MPQPFWDDDAAPSWVVFNAPGLGSQWDTAWLAGKQLPGVVSVKGKTSRKIDIKNSPGSDGATITALGYEPAEMDITLRMWTPAQFVAWQAMLPDIQPKMGKPPAAPLDLAHPGANSYGIKAVIIKNVSIPDVDDKQIATVTITCIQWLTAKKVGTQTAKTAKGPDLTQVPLVAPVQPPTLPAPPSGTNSGP